MASGLENRLTGQVGEFLVCAQLGRLGVVATPFAGNVPGFDVIAAGPGHATVPIQVKTSHGPSWVTRIDRWLRVAYDPRRRRHVFDGRSRLRNPGLIHVFVALGPDGRGADPSTRQAKFFVLTARAVQDIIRRDYLRAMKPRGFRRPQNPSSMHWALLAKDLEPYAERWDLVLNLCELSGPKRREATSTRRRVKQTGPIRRSVPSP